jgi:hypothetical protein
MRGETVPFPDYSFYPTPQLIVAFAAGPARYREAIQGLSDDQIRARPRGPDRWSIQEIIMHTADSEMQGTFRIRKTWSEPGALWPIHDQDIWSREIDYQGQSEEARGRALTLVSLLREQSLPIFRRATADDWARWGTHAEFGDLTLRNLLELYADHMERHVEQILDSRDRLGRPLAMQPLLPRRLY